MERIHVTVRSRPLSPEDAKSSPWRISGNSVFIPNHTTKFDFDRVFGEECKTEEVYRVRTKDIVAAAVQGFNGTVFAYGQTNSGKTHTMRGSATEPGVIPLAVRDLFDIIQQAADREFLLRMSYMEIYNEDINDLLAPEHRKLQIHENLERGIYVAGLREEIVVSPEQVLELMQFGESHRHIGETNMNLYSSRSHTIFRMIIESRDRSEDADIGSSCDAVRVSVLNLVDLAGSERAAKTGAEGVRLKEGSHINKSLMTLGTVIKKLSEGAESQGGHVPYRDSKLTRILQPALGGNANTAIICNITLAQIHADETKSSLQFASRALRVTNYAHVNEILTDAALLKRQKKEIEELREKLQGSHSEHLEKEILNLRNTLLQSELERERISLELEEEKRAQAEQEKVLQEQAKKIKNLSSMVLYSNRDESRDQFKKGKRRDTWCPSNLSRQTFEVGLNVQSMVSAVKPTGRGRELQPLLPFEKLVNEIEVSDNFCQQCEDFEINAPEDVTLPDPCALLHVTSRRKAPLKRKGPPMDDNELVEMQAAYEELFLKFETQRTTSEIRIDSLTRQLADANLTPCLKEDDSFIHHGTRSVDYLDRGLRESDAILVIKQLQEKIKLLEMERSSSQQNLDNVVELATEQSLFAREKLEELQDELQNAREEARMAHDQLSSNQSERGNNVTFDSMIKLSAEIEEFISEVQSSTKVVESIFSLFDDLFETFSAVSKVFSDFRASMCQSIQEQKLIVHDHENLCRSVTQKAGELESDKVELQRELQELRHDAQNHTDSLKALLEQQDLEKAELISQIQVLEKEILCLSSCSLVKEKENLRKDHEKTKMKLKETEFKLKNAIQEKTKLESEKAFAEREIKRLHGQNSLLERDINKRDSLAGRRCDSAMERSSKLFDPKRAKSPAASFEQTMQEDYQKLEVLAFEMEATIASLEEELAAANKENEEILLRNEGLVLDMQVLSEKLNESSSELNVLKEEVSGLRVKLEESTSDYKKLERCIRGLSEEKEELTIQLADALLEMEEEKVIWSSREQASISAIDEQAKLHKTEIMSLSDTLSEVRNQLESCKAECDALKERVTYSEEDVRWEKKCSMEKSLEIDQLKENLRRGDDTSKELKENLQQQLFCKEKAKLKMRLRGTQARLDAFRLRYNEVVDESAFMNKKYEEASEKLKGMLASCGRENLSLKKQLAAARGQVSN